MKYYDFDINTGEIIKVELSKIMKHPTKRKKNVQGNPKRKVQREKNRSEYSK